jgi:hypothetical protein
VDGLSYNGDVSRERWEECDCESEGDRGFEVVLVKVTSRKIGEGLG